MSVTLLPNRSKRCGEIRMHFDDMQLYCICDYCGAQGNDFQIFKNHIKMHCGERLPAGQESLCALDEPTIVAENVCITYAGETAISRPITTIQEETTSELANLRSSAGNCVGESNEEFERDKLYAFIQVIEKLPILWDPAFWDNEDMDKTAAIEEVVLAMQEKFGHNEWRTDLIEEEVKNLFLLWFRIQKGIIEPPWFAKYLHFFESVNYEGRIKMLKSIEVRTYKEMIEVRKDDRKSSTDLPQSKSSGDSSNLNVSHKCTNLAIKFPQDNKECVEPNNIKVDVITSVIKLSKCTTYQQIALFIELFQKREMLWNVKHAQYMNKYEAILACNQIANEMGRNFRGLKFSPKAMLKAARDLISLYNKMTENRMQKLWFYDKLHFLNVKDEDEVSHILTDDSAQLAVGNELDGKRLEQESQNALNINTSQESAAINAADQKTPVSPPKRTKTKTKKLHDLPLSSQGTLRLIELFKRRETLWRKSHTDYYNYGQRMLLYKEIARTLNYELELCLTAKDVQNKIYSLVTNYRRHTLHADYRKLLKFLPRSRRPIYNCQYCELQFVSRKKWIYHQYSHVHSKPLLNPSLKCRNTKLLTSQHLPKPQREHLSWKKHRKPVAVHANLRQCWQIESAPKRYVCPNCETRFATRAQLEVHQREHSGEKPHRCPECGMTFHKLSAKIKHHQGHTKLRPHICKHCHESFYTLYHLNVHMQKHIGNRSHYCGECGKKFISKSCLKIHTKLHRTNRRYKLKQLQPKE